MSFAPWTQYSPYEGGGQALRRPSVLTSNYAYESAGPFCRRLRCSSSRGARHCSSSRLADNKNSCASSYALIRCQDTGGPTPGGQMFPEIGPPLSDALFHLGARLHHLGKGIPLVPGPAGVDEHSLVEVPAVVRVGQSDPGGLLQQLRTTSRSVSGSSRVHMAHTTSSMLVGSMSSSTTTTILFRYDPA